MFGVKVVLARWVSLGRLGWGGGTCHLGLMPFVLSHVRVWSLVTSRIVSSSGD